MVVQLTLPALERLCAGEDGKTIELGLREQVVNEFAKKHLKPLLADENWKSTLAAYRAAVREVLGEREWQNGRYVTHLHNEIANLIRAKVESLVDELWAAKLQALEASKLTDLETFITTRENRAVAKYVDRLSDKFAALEAALDKRVDDRFEERVQAEINRRLLFAAQTVHE